MCEHIHITKFLLQSNADVNVKNRMGETPLHQAVSCKNLKIVKLLLKYKADINAQQNDGETPLHVAVLKGDNKIVSMLLDNGANPNIVNSVYGKTPVHYAIESDNPKILEAIIKYSPNILIKDKLENIPNDLSKTSNLPDLLKSAYRISPEPVDIANVNQQISPSYTRCNSDISLFTDSKAFDSKIKQIEMMHKKIRETVRSSVDTIKKLEYSVGSVLEIETERTAADSKQTAVNQRPELYK